MNAKKLKEINMQQAYEILNEFLIKRLWDPVETNRMSDTQCANRFFKALNNYFKNETSLLFWNKETSINILDENKEIIPMMQSYSFHKYKEENNIN